MKLSYVARQPILNRDLELYGYELLFRNSRNNTYPSIDLEVATSQLVVDHFFKGNECILEGKLGFINFNEKSLHDLIPTALPREKVVIEILEDCNPTQSLLDVVIRLKSLGYILALDDFLPDPRWDSFIPYIDIIKFDIKLLSSEVLERSIRELTNSNITFLAEKVETQEDFKYALSVGFDLFQGYFFSKPEIIETRKVTPSEAAVFTLCKEVSNDNFDLNKIESIFSSDVTLSLNLLKFANSSNAVVPIKSLGHAINFIGRERMRRFVSIVAMTSFSNEKPKVLYKLSIQRAVFCEIIFRSLDAKADSSTAYLVGLLSTLDALLNNNISNITEQLPISCEVKSALIKYDGILGRILKLVKAYERAHWCVVNDLSKDMNIGMDVIDSAYHSSIM